MAEAIKLKLAEMEPSSGGASASASGEGTEKPGEVLGDEVETSSVGVASASASAEGTDTPGKGSVDARVESASVAALTQEQRIGNFRNNLYPRWGTNRDHYRDSNEYARVFLEDVEDLLGSNEFLTGNFRSMLEQELLKRAYDELGGGTSLHWAVRMEDVDLVTAILDADQVDVNAKDEVWKATSLHWAVHSRNMAIVKAMCHHSLAKKFDLTVKDKWGFTALESAILKSNIPMVKVLLQRGNEHLDSVGVIEEVNNVVWREGSMELLQDYFDIQRETWYTKLRNLVHYHRGGTSLHWAVRMEDTALASQILTKGKVEVVNAIVINGYTPLHLAVSLGNLDLVKIMLGEGKINVNARGNDGYTPLHLAITLGNLEMVEIMVRKGKVHVNAKDKNDYTPLHLAVSSRNLDMVKIMVKEGKVHVNAKDMNGYTPLHLAVFLENLDMVEIMVREGKVHVNAKDNIGYTPLHLAVSSRNLDMVKVMVGEGKVHVNAKDNIGYTPLHLAVSLGNLDMVMIMVGKGKIDVNARANNGYTPLHLALSLENLDMVKIMVGEGKVHVNAIDKNGYTPLHLAVSSAKLDIVKIMVAKHLESSNFNVNFVEPRKGYTTLHRALLSGEAENTNMVRELLKCKGTMRLTEECDSGETPLQIAHERGFKDIQKSLLECEGVQRYVDELYRDRQVYVDAANAILVGAALIASVTFASWLQPPLGYGTLGYVDVQHDERLRAFWIFNCLSFYFAIGTVVFGARSVLPRSPYFIKVTVEKLRKNLLVTAFLLAWSVFFVIIAFGIAGCLVLSLEFSVFQLYMIIPTIIGGILCIVSLVCLSVSMWQDSSLGKNTTLIKKEEWKSEALRGLHKNDS